MSKHTPGPWDVDEGNLATIYALETSEIIAEVDARYSREESIANARLIAAAPILLEAAERAEWWLYTIPGSERIRSVLRDAIDQAEGRT